MRESGAKTTWRALASIIGAMEECTSASMSMIKSTDTVFIVGKTAESTKDFGISESSMV